VVKYLTESSNGQYVLGTGDFYEFVHDQVQQAAYTLIDEKSRPSKHLEIGRLLLSGTKETELEERVFDIVTHYNLGADFLTDQAEKVRAAELNLIAGRKARLAAAFAASIAYLKLGLSLLGEKMWQNHYRLTLDLHNELIEACYQNSQYQDVKTLFGTIIEHARQDIDAAIAHKTMIKSRTIVNEPAEAIRIAEEYLEKLDVSLDQIRESDLSVDELYELPPMEDHEKLAALEVLVAITTTVTMFTPERLPSVIFTMLNIISRHGNSTVSSFAYVHYAMHLCFARQYDDGNRFGQLAADLLEKYPIQGRASQIVNMRCTWVSHWRHSVHDLTAPLKTYHRMAMQEGDIEWSLYTLANYTTFLLTSGVPLEFCLSEAELGIHLCQTWNQEFTQLVFLMFAQSALNLTGRSANPIQLEGKWFSEESMLPKLEGNHMLITAYGLLKMTL
ncbi:MAG: hypothetical protein KAJ73_08230, partial [Zetaproteobacteria bacterium]|nr:hypothetical protein [Zetaproteobacteria bacterium]